VIGDEVAGILHRVPANVSGDGKSSIKELVQLKNQDPLRGKGYRTPLEKIQLGEPETIFLHSQGKDFNYVPEEGEVVFLRENSNISTGGDSIDFTDEIPDSYKKIALKAAKALNVRITGLDMIIKDYTKKADKDNYAIIELNFNPAIHIHCHPYKGINRKLNERLLDALGL
jgi:glutamate--cysteine ligase